MLPALANLAPAAADPAPAAALFASVTGAIGLWISGYFALSLSLGLCWILLVSFGRIYARRAADSRTPGLGMSLPLGLRFWQQPPDPFGTEFREPFGNEFREPFGNEFRETLGNERRETLRETTDPGLRDTLGSEIRGLRSSLVEMEPVGKEKEPADPPSP
jgi:hypothetical protein